MSFVNILKSRIRSTSGRQASSQVSGQAGRQASTQVSNQVSRKSCKPQQFYSQLTDIQHLTIYIIVIILPAQRQFSSQAGRQASTQVSGQAGRQASTQVSNQVSSQVNH